MWYTAVPVGLIVLVIVLFFVSNWRYYGRMCSEDHFREFHGKLLRAIEAARDKEPADDPVAAAEQGTAFVTDASLGVFVTFTPAEGGAYDLTISLSQPGRVTTHSLSSSFGFFIVAILWGTHAEMDPYYTESGVHYMAFRLQSPDLVLNDFESSYARYQSGRQPIPFRYEELGSQSAAPSDAEAGAR